MDCFQVLMEHRISIYGPPSDTKDGGGATVVWWPTVRTANVECLIKTGPDRFANLLGAEQLIDTVTIATFDTTAVRGDKVVVTAGPTLVGASFHVYGIGTQPGVDFLGFTEITHLACNRLS